ncbi:MAG: hypothetical protein ACN6I0_00225 [Peredibacter sp.]
MKFLILLTALLTFSAEAKIDQTYFCQDKLGAIPIRQGGRVKPLYVHARELMKYLTGKRSYENLSAVQTYCLLSLQAMGLESPIKLEARVDHVDVQKFFNLPEGKKTIPLASLTGEISRLQREVRKSKDQDSLKKAFQTLLNQAAIYQEITTGNNWLFPALTGDRVDWIPITAFLSEGKIREAKKVSSTPFLKVIFDEVKRFEDQKTTEHLLEYRFMKMRLPIVSMVVTLLASRP